MSREAHEWFYIFSMKKCLVESEELKDTRMASVPRSKLIFGLPL